MESEDRFCSSCGSSIEPEDQFCKKCGEDLHKHTPLAQDHETEPVASVGTSSRIDGIKHFYHHNKRVCLGVLAALIAVPIVLLLFTQTPKIPIALACEAYMVLLEKTQEYVWVNNYEMAIEPLTEAINLIESYNIFKI